MSGVLGLYHLNGAPATPPQLVDMASLLARRGPERTSTWHRGPVGLGHTLLATTPEAVHERLPLEHGSSGCVITADVRLDNREELLAALDLRARSTPPGDAEILLAAYLAWGPACPERLLGDFAFAIWDPRAQVLFCARDPFGMKPFCFHHAPGKLFAFASEPRAILVLPEVPYRINQGRIADFLVPHLEGIDHTSTFFEEVFRLPPAHTLSVTPDGMRHHRYWTLEPGPELRLSSDEAYAEAFREVFTEAVRSRLRSAGRVGSMLSGGMDSGSVAAVAGALLADAAGPPLVTVSGVAPDRTGCVETRSIQAAIRMRGLAPQTIGHPEISRFDPELSRDGWNLDEPFDNHATLVRVMYLAADRQGANVLLDGASGDVVLADGSVVARLIRSGRLRAAWRETAGQSRFYGAPHTPMRLLLPELRTAVTPNVARRIRRRAIGILPSRARVRATLRQSVISPEFADRVALADRLRAAALNWPTDLPASYAAERAHAITHPYVAAARERYDRVASAAGVEPRDPFLDRRLVAFCLSLPPEQRLRGGWPKAILRQAMAGRIPDQVRWRRGKEHLGWAFTRSFVETTRPRLDRELEAGWDILAPYVDTGLVRQAYSAYVSPVGSGNLASIYDAAQLAAWLRRHLTRPRPEAGESRHADLETTNRS